MSDPLVLVRCARCGFPAPIEDEEMTGDGGGDLGLPIIIVPPPGWIGDPDGEGIIHRNCATDEENAQYEADLAEAERLVFDGGSVDPTTAERARLVFGVDPDDDR